MPATLVTLRTGDVENANETGWRLFDDRFDLKMATEGYIGDTEQAVEQQAYESWMRSSPCSSRWRPSTAPSLRCYCSTRAFDGVPSRVPQRAAGGHVDVMGLLNALVWSFEMPLHINLGP